MTEVENLHGCYLLVSENPKYKGRTYIGYTVDPLRRIQQHNKGVRSGGARKTCRKGPWQMVLIVYGFPNEISALRFEWAWQHPYRSRLLQHVKKKQAKEKMFDFCIRVMCEMLRARPWNLLALTICWLKEEVAVCFPVNLSPPLHMPIVYGPILSKKVQSLTQPSTNSVANGTSVSQTCDICTRILQNSEALRCIQPSCSMNAHATCLAKKFLELQTEELMPVSGHCPLCKQSLLWGDLVRYANGCYRHLQTS